MRDVFERLNRLSPEKRMLLEQQLEQKRGAKQQERRIQRQDESGVFPLSFAQERLWFLDQLEPGSAMYNLPVHIWLRGQLDTLALQQSLNTLVERHQILRTVYTSQDSRPLQSIQPFVAFSLPGAQIEGVSEDEREAQIQSLTAQEASRPFDLEHGPLFRMRLLRKSAEEHVLLLTFHHIVFDGWSAGIFQRELTALYKAYCTKQPSPLADVSLQYVDFAVEQRQWLQGERLEQQLVYWQKQLENMPFSVLALPTDYPRPSVQRFQGARYEFFLPATLSDELKSLSKREDVTVFMLLLAAFYTLLQRYTNQCDIPVGTPLANRPSTETEGLIGLFVNTLVLRGNLAGNPRFSELLRRVREMCLDAYHHQEVPFEKIVEKLQPERNLSYNPLFQVMFAFQNMPGEALELPGLSVRASRTDAETTMVDLRLLLIDSTEGLQGILEYNSDLFTEITARHLVVHFQTLLGAIVANPEQRVAELNLLTEQERHLMLEEWNNTMRDYPLPLCAHTLFERQAEKTPDAPAIQFASDILTYQTLNQQANRLAHYLRSKGVGPDVCVGISMERSLEMVISILAVLKAGGAYVPLDPGYPLERLLFILQDSQVKIVLTRSSLWERQGLPVGEVLWVEPGEELLCQESAVNVCVETHVDALAYVIYTSGSTGQPKGVMSTHRGLGNRLLWMQETYQLLSDDAVLQKTPYSFDVSVWEFLWPLISGARIVLARPEGHRDPAYLVEIVREQQITILHFVPSMLQVFLSEDGVALCSSIRRVVCSGEALSASLRDQFFARLGAELHNLYGPTEASIDVTSWSCRPSDATSIVPIGYPIANTQLYILDSALNPLPIGVSGTLYIGGVGLARGYNGRPDLTSEKFLPHPSSQHPGMRLYNSGDLARYRSDGSIEFLGRSDHQIKIRGLRIEPGEIEATIARYPAVQEALVLVRQDVSGGKDLVAYIVPESQECVSLSSLRQYVQGILPEYMVPAFFVTLSAFPLTPHGKIDRQALPPPSEAALTRENIYVAPETPTEVTLARIWSEVLGVEHVGLHDNFFALGGDSLRTIQVKSLAQKANLFFSVQQLFQQQSIAELLAVLQREDSSVNVPSLVPFQLLAEEDRRMLPAGLDDAYPMTLLQIGMVFHSQYNAKPGALAYHDVFSLHVQGQLDEYSLRQAIQRLLVHYPILRTSFELSRFSLPLQLVQREIVVPLRIQDIRSYSAEEQLAVLQNWNQEQQHHLFEVAQAPLWHFQVHIRTNDSFQLTLSFHHAILDGWSVASLITELLQTYRLLLAGVSEGNYTLPATSYRDFVYQERLALGSEECRHYWLRTLQGYTQTTFPIWPLVAKEYEEGQIPQLRVTFPEEVIRGLHELARSVKVPLKSVLLAAHMRVMSVLSGQIDVLTGLVSNGRIEGKDGERVLGLFLNTVPFRLQLSGGNWIQLVRQVFEAEQELWPYRRYPLAQMQKDMGNVSLFDMYFDYRHFHVYQHLETLENIKIVDEEFFERTNFTLTANFNHALSDDNISLLLKYDEASVSRNQVRAIGACYIRALAAMVTQPLEHYETVSLLAEEELSFVVDQWNDTAIEYPQDKCIHELFEEQVEYMPDAIAGVFDDTQLTYRELNRRANRIAHFLQRQGIQAETPVGLLTERSLDMLIGALGILKAGGVYIPLDPQIPQSRLQFILTDAQIGLLLSQRQFIDKLAQLPVLTCYLNQFWGESAHYSDRNPQRSVASANLVYVIYTSGSTGKPKGVMVSHRNVINFFVGMNKHVGDDRQAHWLAVTSISFDISVLELLWTLTRGYRVIIQPDQQAGRMATLKARQSDETIASQMRIQGISHLQMTPSLAQILLTEHDAPDALEHLQKVLLGGESLPTALASRLSKSVTGSLYNMYGPTETTIWSTTSRVLPDATTITIGHPIANTQMYVLDSHLQPVPVGVAGDLYIGGDGLARGYLRRPDLTAERFVPDPFNSQPGARLYQTGDVARYLPDGSLDLLGRSDYQVKIRGYRIELGEIEAALKEHPTVYEAVVLAREDALGDKRLVAYVVPASDAMDRFAREDQAFQQQEWASLLRDALSQSLPEYMLPLAFVYLDALPLTPNGKVDRQALPLPDLSKSKRRAPYVAPSNPLEEALGCIWAEILDVTRVGTQDSFFDLGGDSIKSVRLIDRIQRQLDLHPSLATLFKYPTIAQLAQMLHYTEPESPLIPLLPEQAQKQRVFLIHPLGGHIFCYRSLAQLFGDNFTLYGLQARGFDGKQSPFRRIEDMARYYIEEIVRVQPDSPYIIGGWCMGGTIAFEIARQLRTQGKQVALTALISADADHPADVGLAEDRVAILLYALGLLQVPMNEDIVSKLDPGESAPDLIEQLQAQHLLPDDVESERVRALMEIYQTHARALLNYKPQPYMGKLVVFRPVEARPDIETRLHANGSGQKVEKSLDASQSMRSAYLGWDKLARGGVDIIALPGDHYSIMRDPHVQYLARMLQQTIEHALVEYQ